MIYTVVQILDNKLKKEHICRKWRQQQQQKCPHHFVLVEQVSKFKGNNRRDSCAISDMEEHYLCVKPEQQRFFINLQRREEDLLLDKLFKNDYMLVSSSQSDKSLQRTDILAHNQLNLNQNHLTLDSTTMVSTLFIDEP